VNALDQEIAQRIVHGALPLHAVHPSEGWRLDLHGEMALPSIRVVSAMPSMFLAIVNDLEVRRAERLSQTFRDLGRDGPR
jgi:hypothetical protein